MDAAIALERYFQAGGTLAADAPSYLERAADHELRHALQQSQFAYVLDTRQIGKSSLVARTAAHLRQEGCRVALIDLTRVGASGTRDQWYYALLRQIAEPLGQWPEISRQFRARSEEPALMRFFDLVIEVLRQDSSPLVVFVDEIDAVQNLSFSADEFFAGIRELFTRRALEPDLERITFCLVGSSTPAALIQDVRTTPFNIGTQVVPSDFSLAELTPFVRALEESGRDGAQLVKRVHHWTNGHPYLTQRLLGRIAAEPAVRSAAEVDQLAKKLYLNASPEDGEHLAMISRRFLASEEAKADLGGLLNTFRQIHRRPLAEDPRDPNQALLRLAGVARLFNRQVQIRNEIYRRRFDPQWIAENMPDAELRRIRAAQRRAAWRAAAIAAAIVAVVGLSGAFAATQAIENRRLAQQANQEADKARESEALAQANAREADEARARLDDELRRSKQLTQQAQTAATMAQRQKQEADRQRSRAESQSQIAERRRREAERAEKNARAQTLAAQAATERAEAQTRAAKRLAYISSMQAAQAAADAENWPLLVSIIEDPEVANSEFKGFEWGYWDAQMNQQRLEFKGHSLSVNTAAFSPDGKQIVTASWDGTARVWDAATGRYLAELKGHSDSVTTAAFSPDGKQIVTASNDNTARVWDAATGRSLAELKGHSLSVNTAAFSPDGIQIVTASDDNTARVWDSTSGTGLAVIRGHWSSVNSAAFSPDGEQILTTSGTVRIWEVAPAYGGFTRLIDTPIFEIPSSIGIASTLYAEYSPDQSKIVTAHDDGTVRLWLNRLPIRQQASRVLDERSARDEDTFSTFGDEARDNGFESWPLRRGPMARAQDDPSDAIIPSIEFNNADVRDAIRALFGSVGAKYVIDHDVVGVVSLGLQKQTFEFVLQAILRQVDATYRVEGGVYVIIRRPEMPPSQIPRITNILATFRGHTKAVYRATFSPDGQRLVTSSLDGTARIWDTSVKDLDRELHGHTEAVFFVGFSADRKRIATASNDGTARIWSVSAGEHLATLKGHTTRVNSAEFSSDGKQIVTAGGSVRIWNAQTAHQVSEYFMDGGGFVEHASFAPDGKFLVSASGTARVWSLDQILRKAGSLLPVTTPPLDSAVAARTLNPVGNMQRGPFSVNQLRPENPIIEVFEMNGADIREALRALFGTVGAPYTIANDLVGTVTVSIKDQPFESVLAMILRQVDATYRVEGGVYVIIRRPRNLEALIQHRTLFELKVAQNRIHHAIFSPDGRRIVTASGGNTALVWNAQNGKPVSELRGRTAGVYTSEFSNDGRRVVTASSDSTARVWDAKTGVVLAILKGHVGKVHSARFSSDGERIVTGSSDGTVRIWDSHTGHPLTKLSVSSTNVAAFNVDGSAIVVVSGLNTVYLGELTDRTAPVRLRIWSARRPYPPPPATKRP